MGNLPDWTQLEQDGKIAVPPGREEAVAKAIENQKAKAEALKQAMLDKLNSKNKKRK
jgi:hypothetical protein